MVDHQNLDYMELPPRSEGVDSRDSDGGSVGKVFGQHFTTIQNVSNILNISLSAVPPTQLATPPRNTNGHGRKELRPGPPLDHDGRCTHSPNSLPIGTRFRRNCFISVRQQGHRLPNDDPSKCNRPWLVPPPTTFSSPTSISAMPTTHFISCSILFFLFSFFSLTTTPFRNSSLRYFL